MALLEDIKSFFRRLRSPAVEMTTTAGKRPPGGGVSAAEWFRQEGDRVALIRACQKMYQDDPRPRKVIQSVARDAVRGGFTVETDNKEAVSIAHAVRDRLNLNGRLDDWCRYAFRDGDCFLELVVNGERDIVEVRRRPVFGMHRNSDELDVFADPDFAFWFDTGPLLGPAKSSIWFAEWQIVHGRWDHDEGQRYGFPMFGSAAKPWRRVLEGETDIAVRRKTRAGKRFSHQFPAGTSEADIMGYMEVNKDVLDNPFGAITDFFGTAEIKEVGGDGLLGNIDDIRHHLNTFWMASPVPMALIGYGQDIDFSVIGHQKEEYDEGLPEIQTWVADQFIRPVLKRQWLLKGILPETVQYQIRWMPKKRAIPADVEIMARAGLQLRALGVRDEVIGTIISQFLPGVAVNDLFAVGNGRDGRSSESERLAAIIKGLNG